MYIFFLEKCKNDKDHFVINSYNWKQYIVMYR